MDHAEDSTKLRTSTTSRMTPKSMAFRQDTSSGRGRWLCHFPAGLRRIRIRIPRRRLVTTSTTPHRTGRAEGCPGRTRRASAGSLSVKGERKRSLRGRSDRCRTPVRPPRAGARHSPALHPAKRSRHSRGPRVSVRRIYCTAMGSAGGTRNFQSSRSAALGPTPAARRPRIHAAARAPARSTATAPGKRRGSGRFPSLGTKR